MTIRKWPISCWASITMQCIPFTGSPEGPELINSVDIWRDTACGAMYAIVF